MSHPEYNPQFAEYSMEEFISILDKIARYLIDNAETSSTQNLRLLEKDELHPEIALSSWTDEQKKIFFRSALRGVYHYYFVTTEKTKFPMGAYISLREAINGKDLVRVNRNSIKWFTSEIQSLIDAQEIDYPRLKKRYKKPPDHTDGLSDYGGWEQDEMMQED